MTILDEIKKEGEKIGIEKGEKIGIEKGEKIGIEKGREEGERKKAIETAKKMKGKNLDVVFIADMTELSRDEIENL